MNALNFLITIVFDLALMVIILRVWLQASRANFYNPVSQFVVKATNPLVLPLRRLIPTMGRLDLATVVLAVIVGILKLVALYAASGMPIPWVPVIISGALVALGAFLQLLFWILIIRALLSWFSQGHNPMEMMLQQLTEPMLAPIRRILPAMGGLDLSVLVLIIIVQFVRILIGV
ncbi:YggT family protein [Pseudidiomarina planktonica]|uniref:YggT family protein n=1 Tax=Pseudidiomarina planktonica TaxID=1323738 RepID=A0A1Y6FY25_9GAMM|nr:YggT family protein [Pseudidiomarina planktonica]RUO62917.1 YggT family protein [Pseudidiomarina planktonica]SMQ80807.1 YggT family protein [Pseudidiomarina planktonica]